MTTADLSGIPGRLWARVAEAGHRLLMLDYDGTLAPFHTERDEARPLPEVVALIGRIACEGRSRVAVISGRPVADLQRLLGPLPILLVGEHGWEAVEPDGRVRRHPLPGACAGALERAAAAAAAAGWGPRVERKRCSLVLHTRGLPAAQAAEAESACLRAWEPELARGGLGLDRLDGGLELRARGRDKGTVARELIAAEPLESLPVYLGDDATDEDVFREVRTCGFAIRVGPGDRPSLATGRLRSPEAVVTFLKRWLDEVRGVSASEGR